MPETLALRVAARLRAIRESGLHRALHPPAGADFSSNDYLALAADPRLTDAMAAAVRRDGCGSTGSRLLRGDRDAFRALESRFARFKHAPASLYFSSGYLANLAVLTTLPEAGDVILSDERNHASVIDAVRLSAARHVVFPHDDLHALEALLAASPSGDRGDGHTFVVTESVFSMDGDSPALAAYDLRCRAAGATLIVDEAHAVGLYGANGSGMLEEQRVDHERCLSINSAGKALGVSGAFAAGPEWAIEYLIQRARPFVFSTAPPPAVSAAIDAAIGVVAAEPERRRTLRARVARCRERLANGGLAVARQGAQILPIVVGDNAAAVSVARALQARGFDVRAIRPPTVPPGTARLRVSLTLHASEDLIDRFADAAIDVMKDVPACSAAFS